MEGGVPGAPGVAVVRPVEREVCPGLEYVILLLQLMEEIPALVIAVSLRLALMEKDVRYKVSIILIFIYLLFSSSCLNLASTMSISIF